MSSNERNYPTLYGRMNIIPTNIIHATVTLVILSRLNRWTDFYKIWYRCGLDLGEVHKVTFVPKKMLEAVEIGDENS